MFKMLICESTETYWVGKNTFGHLEQNFYFLWMLIKILKNGVAHCMLISTRQQNGYWTLSWGYKDIYECAWIPIIFGTQNFMFQLGFS